MAKVLLGISLLGCLVRGDDAVCSDPAIEWSAPENASTVRLLCCVNQSAASFYWTHNGYRLPASRAKPGSRLLEVPIGEAKGTFECHVQYSATLSQFVSIALDFSAKKDTSMTLETRMLLIVGVSFLALILVYVPCVLKQRQHQKSMRGRRYSQRRRSRRGREADRRVDPVEVAV